METKRSPWRRAMAAAIAAGITLALAIGLPHRVSARTVQDSGACSNATLHGDYGRLSIGIRPAPANPAETESFVGTGVRTYDGNGTFTEVSSSHGQISPPNRNTPGYGTYVVNVDCTGTARFFIAGAPFPIESSFVIVGHGEEVKQAVMSPQSQVVSYVESRINR